MPISSAPLTIRPLSYAAGTEIIGLNLREELPESTIEWIKDVWGEHLVLLFRNQPLTPDQQIAFTSRFGELTVFDGESVDGYPQILRVTNKTIGA